MKKRGMGGHHSPVSETEVWLTPPAILKALGGAEAFDLDPCAVSDPRPWPTAKAHFTRESNGLAQPWAGRVWMNPPYGGPAIVGPWMRRLVAHGDGLALIFARTETEVFFTTVWEAAAAVLFLRGRLFFHRPDGRAADHNAGAPSVLVAYGEAAAEQLRQAPLDGQYLALNSGRSRAGLPLFEAAE